MDVTPLIARDRQVIQSYSGGKFRVSGTVFEGAVIVTPEKAESWAAPGFDELAAGHFDSLSDKSGEIDVVLLGSGAVMRFLPPALRNELKNKRLKVEVMDTGAACRTYNVLMAEGRRVAAALLPSEVGKE